MLSTIYSDEYRNDFMEVESMNKIPQMMTVRQMAATGILPENAIRSLLKQGKLPAIYSGKKALINFELVCEMLQGLKAGA